MSIAGSNAYRCRVVLDHKRLGGALFGPLPKQKQSQLVTALGIRIEALSHCGIHKCSMIRA